MDRSLRSLSETTLSWDSWSEKTLVERVRAALGDLPSVEARELQGRMTRQPDLQRLDLKYGWIQDWIPLLGLGVHEGEEWVTFFIEEEDDNGI